MLQSLGARRGQLDQREQDLDTQLALMAAAEAKLDAKIKRPERPEGRHRRPAGPGRRKEAAEIDRLVKVFEGMKPKDAAARMALLDDSVRLPIAAKMKERALSAIMAQMPPAEAKKLTESLAHRFARPRPWPPSGRTAAPLNAGSAQAPAKAAAPKPAAPSSRASAPAAATPAGEPPKAAS